MSQELTLDLLLNELDRRGIALHLRGGKVTTEPSPPAGLRSTLHLLESEVLAHLLTRDQAPPPDKMGSHGTPEAVHKTDYAAALERFADLAQRHKVTVDTAARLVVIQPRTAHLAAELYVTAPWGVIHLDGQPWSKWGDPPGEATQPTPVSSRLLKYLNPQASKYAKDGQ